MLVSIVLLITLGVIVVLQVRIERKLTRLLQEDNIMAQTLQQLDAAIAAEGVEETTLAGAVTALQSVITQLGTDIQALITIIQNLPGEDFTNEVNAVNANLATATATATAVASAVAAVTAEDTSVTGESGNLGGSPQVKPTA
jgi:hypothetical protein